MRSIVFIIVITLLSSCLKEEFPIPKITHGDLTNNSVTMGTKYGQQVYFDFSQNKVTASIEKMKWDLGFENGAEGWHVITNAGKNMFVYPTQETDFALVMSKEGYSYVYESEDGNIENTAIGNWKDGFIRILDLGADENGVHLGWYKIKCIEVTSTQYTFQFAPLDVVEKEEVMLSKNNETNFIYYNLRTKKQVGVEPKSSEWDVVFRQYIVHLTEPLVMDYLVVGCLTNRFKTSTAVLNNVDFDAIDFEYTQSLDFSYDHDRIGYSWKDIDIFDVMEGNNGEYTIDASKSYVIKDGEGRFFKLRFVDFYSQTGEKGTPTFEFQEVM